MEIIRTERGWAGHFRCAQWCQFRRNTLVHRTSDDTRIVVSTVGNYMPPPDKYGRTEIKEVGFGRYHETMAFLSDSEDAQYHDADVSQERHFESNWRLGNVQDDNLVNAMHEAVVAEFITRLQNGELFKPTFVSDDNE